jgi:hypothetical protein
MQDYDGTRVARIGGQWSVELEGGLPTVTGRVVGEDITISVRPAPGEWGPHETPVRGEPGAPPASPSLVMLPSLPRPHPRHIAHAGLRAALLLCRRPRV